MYWQDKIVDWSMEKAIEGFDRMFRELLRRFEDGNPMRWIAASQFKRVEDQMYDARSAEAWNKARNEFRHLLVTLLNNIFDSFDNPAGIEEPYVDKWLLANGFGDGTIQAWDTSSLLMEEVDKYIQQQTQGEQE